MTVRVLKVVFVAIVGLMALLYGVQNIANLDSAFGAVSYVGSMKEHAAYPSSVGPAIASPHLTWAILAFIISAEIAAGLVCLGGAAKMWGRDARRQSRSMPPRRWRSSAAVSA